MSMGATGSRVGALLQRLLLLRSSPCKLQPLTRFLSSSSVDNPDSAAGSIVYRHTLKTQRPTPIHWHRNLLNSVTFIGTLTSPLKSFTSRSGKLGVHTQLQLDPQPESSNKIIRVFLDMWEDMAELSIQHLKPNDYIYVSGYLQSFTRALDNGNVILYPKVLVKEINFVENSNQKCNNIEDAESALEKQRKRLYLWQVFFANPYEWQDLRKRKVNPSQPDFKHKGSGEALWLRPNDPPWVTRQLQLQDSRMGDMGLLHSSRTSGFQL